MSNNPSDHSEDSNSQGIEVIQSSLQECAIEGKMSENLFLEQRKDEKSAEVEENTTETSNVITTELKNTGTCKKALPNVNYDAKSSDTKLLKRLEINKHTKFMKDFDPEKSKREARKLEKLPGKEKKSKQRSCHRKYDEKGIYIATGEDLCDCLIDDCPGCHFPCQKCRSCKCGPVCRRNRTWCYEEIEIEGTGEIIRRNR